MSLALLGGFFLVYVLPKRALQVGFIITRVRSPILALSEARRTKPGGEGCSCRLGVPWVASFFWAPSILVQGLVPGRDLLLWEGMVNVH